MAQKIESSLNKITGKITHKETGLPIPDLVVEIYDLDPFSEDPDANQKEFIFVNPDPGSPLNQPSTYQSTNQSKFSNGVPGDRLGSTVSDTDGNFEITYADNAFRIRSKNRLTNNVTTEYRPDLFLLVLSPEESGHQEFENVIYRSNWARINAGRSEFYRIQLNTEQLKKHQIDVPSSIQENTQILKSEQIEIEQKINANAEIVAKVEAQVYKDLGTLDISEPTHLLDINKLSEKQHQLLTQSIAKLNNNPNPAGVIFLTGEQKKLLESFKSADGSTYENVPSEIFNALLSNEKSNPQSLLDLIKEDPVVKFCKSLGQDEKCSRTSLGLEGTGEGGAEPGNEPPVPEGGLENFNLEAALANLMNTQSSPEQAVYFGKEKKASRPTQSDIQQSVNSFALQASPADEPAYYDFNQLVIAFDSLWYELIDEEVINLTRQAYHEINKIAGENESNKFTQESLAITDIFKAQISAITAASSQQIPVDIIRHFEINIEQYQLLSKVAKLELLKIAQKLSNPIHLERVSGLGMNIERARPFTAMEVYRLTEQGKRIIYSVSGDEFTNLHSILKALKKRLAQNFNFTIYAASRQKRSINFGLLLTYRQQWTPINYQVGELIKTIPLAPKEERKFFKKVTIRKKRNEKEIEKNNSTYRDEINTTDRLESEAVKKAMNKTDFSMASEGGFSFFGLGKGSQNNNLAISAETASEEIKKNFREAVIKSLNELKTERTIDINTEESYDSEMTESGTITNPNDEIPVTYLFYELQRRYKVSEGLHRARPVIFVAQEMPNQNDIDEDWLIGHDWILKRVMLDDSFLPALSYLSTNIVGDEYALRELKKNIDLQRSVVEELKIELQHLTSESDKRYDEFETYVNNKIDTIEAEDTDGWLSDVGDFFGGGGQSTDAVKLREEAAEEAYQRSLEKVKEAKMLLTREISNLNALTEKYTKQLSNHMNRKTQVERLKVHVKENILHYMQAIWSYEPEDQRYFRLHRTRVPQVNAAQQFYDITVANKENILIDPAEQKTAHDYVLDMDMTIAAETDYKLLEEVADLDNLLGFKGNYMIFPLKVNNAITDYMLAPYLAEGFRLRDPDEYGNMNLADFSKYVCCIKANTTEAEFEQKYKPILKKYYDFLIQSPLRSGEDVIVPTGNLFIEALPGEHSLLEDFKLMHRAVDVKKVQAEVRQLELENLRYAVRLQKADLEDPDVEKKIIVDGKFNNIDINE